MKNVILSVVMAAVVAICFCGGAFATDGGRAHHPVGSKSARVRALARDPYADPAAPYKANRLSSSRERIINIPSQTTVITRSVMDDKNVTSIGGALRTTPGVTVGR
jgi:outer membrane receptor for monomeric catechols